MANAYRTVIVEPNSSSNFMIIATKLRQVQLAYNNETVQFQVHFNKLFQNCTEKFSRLLQSSTSGSLSIDVSDLKALEIVLRWVHGYLDPSTYSSADEEFYNVDHALLYEVIHLCMQWFKTEDFEPWFTKYLSFQNVRPSINSMSVLLFPCRVFRHAEAFGIITQALVFESVGEIRCRDPNFPGRPRHPGLICDSRIMRQLNGVKTRIRDREIANPLIDPIDELCAPDCELKGQCIMIYRNALRKTEAWPSITRSNRSIKAILDSQGMTNWSCGIPSNASDTCKRVLSGRHIGRAKEEALTYWNGLCIDCMECTLTEPISDSFWEASTSKNYSRDCRIDHGRNTWYHSYMGAPHLMSKHQAEQKKREAESGRTYGRNPDRGIHTTSNRSFPQRESLFQPRKPVFTQSESFTPHPDRESLFQSRKPAFTQSETFAPHPDRASLFSSAPTTNNMALTTLSSNTSSFRGFGTGANNIPLGPRNGKTQPRANQQLNPPISQHQDQAQNFHLSPTTPTQNRTQTPTIQFLNSPIESITPHLQTAPPGKGLASSTWAEYRDNESTSSGSPEPELRRRFHGMNFASAGASFSDMW